MNTLALLTWYGAKGRRLPWRDDPQPYHVLLSEFMCQQTRVETALPYYEAFRSRWPTLGSLAAAPVDDVVEAWAGLGYYSRARRLHAVAVVASSAGGLPSQAHELAKLPGIGPYTAGAIASIAFGEPVPAVDGNVDRVLARHRGVELEVNRPEGKREITRLAAQLHRPETSAGDLNQALMELGARVCTPRKPTCGECPVRSGCVAFATDRVGELPRKRPKKKPIVVEGVAGVLVDGEQVLLVKRAGEKLLGGLWTPPVVMEVDGANRDALVEAFGGAGVKITSMRALGEVRHVFSHRDLRCRVYEVRGDLVGKIGEPWSDVRWTSDRRGMSSLGQKILDLSRSLPLLAPLLAADDSR